MKWSNIQDQDWFFYNTRWKKEMDKMLLAKILTVEKETGSIAGTRVKSPQAILTAMVDINRVFEKSLTFVDIEDRLKVLEGRYNIFKKLMNMPECHWDRELNRIYATDEVWDKIFTENIWAQAYYYAGELEYYKLCALFGPKHIKAEATHEIIQISSSMNTIELSDDDEVTSPIANGKKKVSRMLFPSDAESSYVPPSQGLGKVFMNWPSLQPNKMFPPLKALPSKVSTPEPNYASSCASCSPFK